jgi:trehalose-6-phosphate synthase
MGFTLRLLAVIWLSAVLVVGAFAFVSIRAERARFADDLSRRAWLLGESLREAVTPLVASAPPARVERLIRRFGAPGRGIAVYDRFANLIVATPEWAPRIPQPLPFVSQAVAKASVQQGLTQIGGQETHYYAVPLATDDADRPVGALVVFQDAGHLDRLVSDQVRSTAVRGLVVATVLSLIIFGLVRWSITHPLARMVEWAHQLRAGRALPPPDEADPGLFGPLATEVSGLARSLNRARAAAAEEARLRLEGQSLWTEERLKQVITARLQDRPLFVVSNREPFVHVWRGRTIEVVTPASGLVTALDPVMRACGGVWVAYGGGSADREVVDDRNQVRVPPEDPRYTLKRVWLSPEEYAGYYLGFANEGLWPLCHIVHARPEFRPEDWAQYQAVNARFADALLEALSDTEAPAVLIQDYHFALLPRLVREKRPDARVALFWHIPWPNPEAFGICPWQAELLHGMLGADLVGFHTQFHCNNFLETVDRAVEARTDWEHFSVDRGQHTTLVKPFPISVAPAFVDDPPKVTRAQLLAELGLDVEFLGVGVERLDYTKGLPERIRAIGRFFDQHPGYRERMTFVQLAAQSRTEIPRYRALVEEVRQSVETVNSRLQTGAWRPILLLTDHYNHRDLWSYYRWADFCMVTSLHDGMNLVAKEFVSVRDDDDGALILSRFTGAARELRDALLVNPYDIDGTAEAIRIALEMAPAERRGRMLRMRQVVREHNIYRWAGLLLGELARLPAEDPGGRPA